jgi:excinuclease ABC subunit C
MRLEDLKAKKLPDSPGVYFFIGKDGEILYVGKATSLRDRVRSYFSDDIIHTRGALIVDMVTQAAEVDYITTDSVLEAVIVEANEIKKHQPRGNSREKDDKSFNYVVITAEEFPKVLLVRGKDLQEYFPKKEIKYVFGPYPHGLILREGLKIIRKIFPFRDAKCQPHQGRPCFNRQIGLCPGVCTGEMSKKDYQKTILNLKLFFEGKKHDLLKQLEKQMREYAKAQEFEKAGEVKKTIFALTHIQDITLIRAEKREAVGGTETKSFFRIEAYDIAHMSGKNTGGVMVVLEDKHIKKTDYRMFKIRRTEGVNDIAGLKEVIDRRLNHHEWTYPNLIVVDGGMAQLNAAKEVLKLRGFDIGVAAVTKNERHKPVKIVGDENVIKKYQKEILLVNSEAHRFAIKYHRKMRSRAMF